MSTNAYLLSRHAAIVAERRQLGLAARPRLTPIILAVLAALATASSIASLSTLG